MAVGCLRRSSASKYQGCQRQDARQGAYTWPADQIQGRNVRGMDRSHRGDTIVLDNRAVTKAAIHPPHLQLSYYDLHQASYSLIAAKQFYCLRQGTSKSGEEQPFLRC